jgi:hypothetical protein
VLVDVALVHLLEDLVGHLLGDGVLVRGLDDELLVGHDLGDEGRLEALDADRIAHGELGGELGPLSVHLVPASGHHATPLQQQPRTHRFVSAHAQA